MNIIPTPKKTEINDGFLRTKAIKIVNMPNDLRIKNALKDFAVNDKGVLKGKKVGYTGIYIDAATADGNTNYDVEGGVVEVEVVKAANPMTLKAKTVKMKAKDLKKKAKTIKRVKAFTVKNAKGTLSYKLVSAKKGTKNFKKKFKINAKTGKVTVKKGLKKGTYKVTVKVKAKGNSSYKASSWKKVTFKVKVK